MLISCAVTAQLICIFVVAYAKSQFSHDAAHLCNRVDRCDEAASFKEDTECPGHFYFKSLHLQKYTIFPIFVPKGILWVPIRTSPRWF